MASRTRLFLSSFAACLALAPALAPALAAELGDVRTVSHIGQPLVADIELAMLEDAATPVQVRVASPEVYNGAGIAVPPVLSSLQLSVMRRDGRQFLHVTAPRAVDADHVHLYLELTDKGQRAVRLATLWLTPDPNPAPAPAAPAVPNVTPARMAATAGKSVPDAVLLAQVERARMARAPSPAAGDAPARQAHVLVRRPHPAPAAKAPALAVVPPDIHPPACARPAGEAQACAALGAKNDALRVRLGQVEDRMKKLQATLGAPAAIAAPAVAKAQARPEHQEAPPKVATAKVEAPKQGGDKKGGDKAAPAHEAPKPAGPRPIHSIKPLVPHKPATPPDEGLPWGWIGVAAGLLALGGAGALVVVRRRKPGGGDGAGGVAPAAPGTPGLFARLKARFAARTRTPQAEEPTLE